MAMTCERRPAIYWSVHNPKAKLIKMAYAAAAPTYIESNTT